jgi:hypothetical protein
MATWQEVVDQAPELAAEVQRRFDAHRHKTMATLRKDGSPRISGIEAAFKDGELWLGMMGGSQKARDLLRDPRLALHSASEDPPDDPAQSAQWTGDAKVAGRAVEVTDPARLAEFGPEPGEPFHLFRVDLTEAVLTRVGDPPDHLVIEFWHAGQGLRRVERK